MEEILILDDDQGFRKLLETILTGEGYRVTTAGTLSEALRNCERKQFHLIVSDLRMAILCDDIVEADDLPITASGPSRPVLFKEIERQAILDALQANGGNRTRTAEQLGISLRTLQYRLKDYGIAQG